MDLRGREVARILFFIFISANFGLAQPGFGGGGLRIEKFYDEELKEVKLPNPNYKFRAFTLKDTTVGSPIEKEFYLANPAYIGHFNTRYFDNPYHSRWDSFRYYVVKEKDTMVIDFHGIPSPNHNSSADYMDSLVFRKGYHRYFRNPIYFKLANKQNKFEKQLLRNGFTPSNIRSLEGLGWISVKKNVPSFLKISNKHLPYYYIHRARLNISKDPKRAFADIRTAKRSKLTIEEKQHFLYTSYLFNKYHAEPKKALWAITKLAKISAKPEYYDTYWSSYLVIDNLKKKIELRKQLERESNLIKDYDEMVKIAYYGMRNAKDTVQFERYYNALYVNAKNSRTDYLHRINDYSEEIDKYTKKIEQIPFESTNGKPETRLFFGEEFYYLGKAKFLMGKEKAAFRNWLIFADHGGSQHLFEEVLPYIDTIVSANPENTQLRLIKGAMNLHAAFSIHKREREEYLRQALNDFAFIEGSKFDNYKLNYYKAKALFSLHKYDEAKKQVDLAIKRNKKHALSYLLRHKIHITRNGLENNQFRFKSQDYQEYLRLKKNWKFPK